MGCEVADATETTMLQVLAVNFFANWQKVEMYGVNQTGKNQCPAVPTFTRNFSALSSARNVFTTEFEMDSGGTRLLWPPGKSVDPASWRNTESIKLVVKELDMHFSEHTTTRTARVLYGQASRAISTG